MFEFGDIVSLDLEQLKDIPDDYKYYKNLLPNLKGIIIGKRFENQRVSHYWIVDPDRQGYNNHINDSFELVSIGRINNIRQMNWYKLSDDVNNYVGCSSCLVLSYCVIPKLIDIVFSDKETYKSKIYPRIGKQFLLKDINAMVEIVEISHDKNTAWVEPIKKV